MRVIAAMLTPDPLKDNEGQPMAQFVTNATAEQSDLVDPYMVDPTPLFKWSVDDTLKEVALESISNDPDMVRIFEATESFMGLNRPELLKERYNTYQFLKTFKDILDLLADGPERTLVLDQIKTMMQDAASYAGMVRYFVNVEWQLDLN